MSSLHALLEPPMVELQSNYLFELFNPKRRIAPTRNGVMGMLLSHSSQLNLNLLITMLLSHGCSRIFIGSHHLARLTWLLRRGVDRWLAGGVCCVEWSATVWVTPNGYRCSRRVQLSADGLFHSLLPGVRSPRTSRFNGQPQLNRRAARNASESVSSGLPWHRCVGAAVVAGVVFCQI